MSFKVELKPHLGLLPNGRAIDHNQTLVYCEGKQVGIYCGRDREPGKYLSFINVLFEVAAEKGVPAGDIIKEVLEAMKAKDMECSRYDTPPAPFGEPLDGYLGSTEIVVSSEGVSGDVPIQ